MISFPEMLLRLVLALLLGALIGFERESHAHDAGLRTLALVSLGSSLFTIISAYGFMGLLGIPHIQLDPTRIASYIIAGIGFLGAGTIFTSRNQERVKGLTTAACIWIVAAIGMACGAGLLLEAVVVTILTLIVLTVLRYMERLLLPKASAPSKHLSIEATADSDELIDEVYSILTKTNIRVETLNVHTEQNSKTIEISCRPPNATTLAHAVGQLSALPGVHAVHSELHGTSVGNMLSSS